MKFPSNMYNIWLELLSVQFVLFLLFLWNLWL